MKTLVLLALSLLYLSLLNEKPVQNQQSVDRGEPLPEGLEDPRLKLIREEIAKTTPEGKEIIKRVKRMLPYVNGQLSALPLEVLVEKYGKENKLTPIGWTAAIKRNGRWKVLFYYQDDKKEYTSAEWEYNPEEITLYPFDLKNANQFWYGTPDGK